MVDAAATGAPHTRHPWMHFWNDEVLQQTTTQFMVGGHVMMAPVLKDKVESVMVYLPALGNATSSTDPKRVWTHWLTGQTYDGRTGGTNATGAAGRWYNISAPLGQPAAFIDYSALATWRRTPPETVAGGAEGGVGEAGESLWAGVAKLVADDSFFVTNS